MTEPRRLGKYRLLRRIAVGGVAEVYLAVAEGTAGFEKRVVVKRLMPARARDAAVVAMFLDEARLMALFRHPHVAEVYDIGAEGAERFFAMEYVDGCDLRDVLDDQPGVPLPLPAALAIVRAVALGLGHAHAQKDSAGQPLGVVHRDVSPSNVLLGRAGEVKLVDFGVAKWTSQRSHTEHGTLKGKFAYMSPEQCRGEVLDGRSDLFALGVLLYELTTGVRPFTAASDFELMSAIVRGQFPPPAQHVPDYPAALQDVISRALAPACLDRFASAQLMVAALDEVGRTLGIVADAAAVAALLVNRTPARTATPGLPAPVPGRGVGAARASADRTATDWSTPPPSLAAAPSRGSRPRRAGRAWAVVAGGVAMVSAALLWWQQARVHVSAAAASSPAPIAAPAVAPEPAEATAPVAPVGASPPTTRPAVITEGDPVAAPAPGRPTSAMRPPAGRPSGGRRAPPDRASAGSAASAAAASADPAADPALAAPAHPAAVPGANGANVPGKVIWDPDSPLPP